MKAVYKRELRSYFENMTGFVITAGILLFLGIYTVANNLIYGAANFEYALSGMGLIFLFAAVFLTMGSFSTERRRKTDQLLLTSPASLAGIVTGKYLAMVTVFAIPFVIMCFYPLILSIYGDVGFKAAYAAIFTLFMLACAITAIGMFISSLTENIIISAAVSLGVMLIIYFFEAIAGLLSASSSASLIAFIILALIIAAVVYAMTHSVSVSAIVFVVLGAAVAVVYGINSTLFEGLFAKLLSSVALFTRFDSVTSGMFDITAVIFYITTAVLFCFLTKESMEKRRWS